MVGYRAVMLLSALLVSGSLAGCGSVRTAEQSGGEDAIRGGAAGFKTFQPRDELLQCLRAGGAEAIAVGEDVIQMLPAGTAPRIVMQVEPAAAVVRQIRGNAEGAEVIGRAVVYAGRSSDSQVELIQDCL